MKKSFSAFIFFDGDIEEAALYMQIRSKVIEQQDCRASFLQRTFKLGYARAARFIDALDADGVVSPIIPGQYTRKVIIK